MSRDLDEVNPYASPSAPLEASAKDSEPSDLRLFLLWEKRRLIYNAILAAVTIVGLLVAPPRTMPLPFVLISLLPLGFAANLCFCLGPVLDGYARLVGLRQESVSFAIFALGTAFAVLLTLFAVYSFNMGGFD